MKYILLFSVLFLLISSCHNYYEEDYINNCNQRCINERVCISAECQCPPNTYSFKYKCIPKDSTDLYYATMENTIFACKEQAVLYAPKKDISTDPYYGVYIYFENQQGFPIFFGPNKYYKRTDGDIISCKQGFPDFINCASQRNSYLELFGKFKGQDTLDAFFYIKDNDFKIIDSANIVFVHNKQ